MELNSLKLLLVFRALVDKNSEILRKPLLPLLADQPMFRSILILLTTTVVGIHAIMGCCSHSPFAVCPKEIAAKGSKSQMPTSCCCAQRLAFGCTDPLQDGNGDHAPHECDDEKCNFVSILRSDQINKGWAYAEWTDSLGFVAEAFQIRRNQPQINRYRLTSNRRWSFAHHDSCYTQVWRL